MNAPSFQRYNERNASLLRRAANLALGILIGGSALTTLTTAAPYEVESIEFPHWAAPEVGALGFTPDGRLVVALRRHGILMAEPSENPTEFPWRAFSTDSLHNPCGIQVVSDSEIIVSQMQELTRITDTDGDGIGDLYQVINDDWGVSGNYHETNALVPDGEDGWYLALGTASHNGPTFYHTRGEFAPLGRTGRNFAAVPWKGWVVQVSAEGELSPFAKGFRAHNGIARSPDGKIYATDNQGDWRGTSPLYHVEEDKFYGHPSSLVWDKDFLESVSEDPIQYFIDNYEEYEDYRTPAAIEFPHGFMCNSPSEPIFDTTDGAFGPFSGQLFVGDIAGDRIIRCMLEEVNGTMQGACTVFIEGRLGAGNNRLIFSPDGSELYVGQTARGWARELAEGVKRIRFTGETPFAVKTVKIQPDGFNLEFTQALPENLESLKSQLEISSYWYKSHHPYGSPQLDVQNHPIDNLQVSADRKTLKVKFAGLARNRIFELNLPETLTNSDGLGLDSHRICYTVRELAH